MSSSQPSDISWTSRMEHPCPGQVNISFHANPTAMDPDASCCLQSTQNAGQVGSEDGEVGQRYSHTQAPCSPAEESKYRHFRHSQAPVYIGSFSLTINTSPNTPMTPKESHGLHLSCPHVIPSTPNEERAVDEDRAAQTDSEVDGI
ncbi:hypothetical protein FOXYSP1_20364 [Fusarium oxysporum f. sp. phaseoli]